MTNDFQCSLKYQVMTDLSVAHAPFLTVLVVTNNITFSAGSSTQRPMQTWWKPHWWSWSAAC